MNKRTRSGVSVTVYPQASVWQRAPLVYAVTSAVVMMAIAATEWWFQSANMQVKTLVMPEERMPDWWTYTPLAPLHAQNLFALNKPKSETIPLAAEDTNEGTIKKPAPQPPVQPTKVYPRFQLSVSPTLVRQENLLQRWQVAVSYQQVWAWEEAQNAYEDVLRMDADYLPAWQGLLAVATALHNQSLQTYCQQQLKQRWPDGWLSATE